MLTQTLRLLKRTNDDMVDVSLANADKSGIEWDCDFLYAAQKFPFNNFFLMLTTPSVVASNELLIEYWSNNEWKEARDILDASGGMTKNGMVQFALQRKFNWQLIDDTSDEATSNTTPEELVGLDIDDMYWIRISLANAPTSGTKLERMCYAFTTTDIIHKIDTDASKFLEDWETGKTDWLPEIITASEMLVSEMKTGGLLKSPGQIMLLDDFSLATGYRTLEHIYFNMGKAYDERRRTVRAKFDKFLSGILTVDQNLDGRNQRSELGTRQAKLVR